MDGKMKCQLKLRADLKCEGKVRYSSVSSDGGALYVCEKHLKAYCNLVKLVDAYKVELSTKTALELEELINEQDDKKGHQDTTKG
jgi:hypothetical protein